MSIFNREFSLSQENVKEIITQVINEQINELLNTQTITLPYETNHLYMRELRSRVEALEQMKRNINKPQLKKRSCQMTQSFGEIFGEDE